LTTQERAGDGAKHVEFVELDPHHPRLDDAYRVIRELRTELTEEDFRRFFAEWHPEGYRLVALFDDGECRAAAGFHLTHGFLHGRFMYVDDLVTSDRNRSKGYGRMLNQHLHEVARANGCATVQLDSGTQRKEAHRFYLRERYDITSFHFCSKV
jgi:GNAT superfamily N-acetyltransferase